ncbi:hypothetical protein B0T18DRAFT_408298 [Schizothecium vesticola]|uniref:Uncharacterized protein n=1 Tax=Schizothecium vesticola TaxID=314040 RepID=A0AA40F2U7_9PEZI|nr:hypothetical protein B0T18DRAFT_408298 [Schizothecium vesticola]
MALSDEAIIKLRSPSSGAAQQDWQPPTVSWLRQTWCVTHSTHVPSHYHCRKNVRVSLTRHGDDETCYSVELSHQDAQGLRIKSAASMLAALDFSTENKTASTFTLSGPSRAASQLEVLAWGKEGQLEEWMKVETNGMISDPSGEWRQDWRNSYVVVLIGDGERKCAVEVWDGNGDYKPLSGETIGKIKDALLAAGIEGELRPVRLDGGRKQDDEEKRKAAEGPVCTDIVLDEEDARSRWCCF